MKYRLSKSAEQDLRDIWNYTIQTWGETQAERYLRSLEKRFLDLSLNPTIGRARTDVAEELLSFHEAHHVIFYRSHQNGIAIARILHERMDLPQKLQEDAGEN